MNLCTAAQLTREFIECRLKIIFAKKYARQFQIVQLATNRFRVDKRRAENFEGSRRSAAFRNIRSFEQAHSRIGRRRLKRGDVWRRHYPGKSALIEPHRALPIFHRQDRQPTFWERLITKLGGEFADGAAVADRDRMHADKRFVAFLDRRSFDCYAVDRIWPIQNDDSCAPLLTRPHAKIKRPNEGVVTRADILKIDNESFDIIEHFGRWFPMFTVQTVKRNSEAWMLITFPLDHVVLSLAKESVLWTEEGAELKQLAAQFLESLRCMFQLRRNRSRMQQRPNSRAAQFLRPKVLEDRKSTRLNSRSPMYLVCRLLLEKKNQAPARGD